VLCDEITELESGVVSGLMLMAFRCGSMLIGRLLKEIDIGLNWAVLS
jgi:hypothetical protein